MEYIKFLQDSFSPQNSQEYESRRVISVPYSSEEDISISSPLYTQDQIGKRVNLEYEEGELKIIVIEDENVGSKSKTRNAFISKKIYKTQYLNKTNQKLRKYQSRERKVVQTYPGESKNIPKNFTRALKDFILNHFDSSVQQNPQIKKFLDTKPEKACKQTLQNSLQSCQQLKKIAQMFFGNLKWGTIFLKGNKVDLETYFKFNQIWFESIN
ncbi:unnamed protein product (macronuclear) [Paramecium tetraurelia]|uniref:Uncharacterized protein n=1 Tax=Paramecium tetraurelia TaxID=5888 RepID=A0DUG9_PARTE|nr:uncharacterized protein GSPATT00020358001 [Paramecium tetraurelia]CAK86686.1 unnamed protein product [Paramecium tetraurelia]|eukprot:XP_001454083.1 hypothetical protein (macronuclear) [Paramecium tetraurelia strain d4-2]